MAVDAGARRPALLIDIGGVLALDHLTAAAADWGNHLGIAPPTFLDALFAGNDDQILIGRVTEAAWWRTVADRLHVNERLAARIRADLAERQTWNTGLLTGLRRIHAQAKISIVSNAWPSVRIGLADAGLLELADAIVLSCEVGCAKPDPRIYATALHRVHADPADALFVDDTPGHVNAARSLGMAGHLHIRTAETLAVIENFVGSPHRG